MVVCPSCYSEVGKDKKHCPYCNFHLHAVNSLFRRDGPFKAVLLFLAISGSIVITIFLLDFAAGGGLNLSFSSCGANEECLIQGMAVCDTLEASPQAFGIAAVKIMGERNGFCDVDVQMFIPDGLDAKPKEIRKTCSFAQGDWSGHNLKDLYMCEPGKSLPDEEFERTLIQGAFLPLDEQVAQK